MWFRKNRQWFSYEHDIHSHILPGIDDGVKTFDESLEIIRRMSDLGVRHMTITPHIAPPYMPNNRDSICPLLEQLKQLVQEEHLKMQLSVAAEYRVSQLILPLIEADDLLSAPDRSLLVEHHFFNPSPFFDEAILQSQARGYFPILAHPERYSHFQDNLVGRCRALRDRDCRIQVNLLSFAGHYGRDVQNAANELLKAGQIDFVASDAHNVEHVAEIREFLWSRSAKRVGEYLHKMNYYKYE
ncbi:MAG: CpsB/CapC family capsule biosynthesis tyrosine phosphatase [Bacteroidales bacterium]